MIVSVNRSCVYRGCVNPKSTSAVVKSSPVVTISASKSLNQPLRVATIRCFTLNPISVCALSKPHFTFCYHLIACDIFLVKHPKKTIVWHHSEFFESEKILVKINISYIKTIRYDLPGLVAVIKHQLMTVQYRLLFGLVSLTACQIDLGGVFGNDSKDGTYPNVEEELWPYFARFEKEAAQRGLTVDLKDAVITGVISDISADHVIGQCSYSNQDPHKVTVDKPFGLVPQTWEKSLWFFMS